MLNLFYLSSTLDRWLPRDGAIAAWSRRIGAARRPSGQTRVFLNLTAGLSALGVPYRVNDFARARRHPHELCCIIGRRRAMSSAAWTNPLMIGPSVYDHPLDAPHLLTELQVRRLLVPGEWMRRMCEPYWGTSVFAWPVGIDTASWAPPQEVASRDIDVLVYDKILWNRDQTVPRVLGPVHAEINRRHLRHVVIRYGEYEPSAYRALLARAHAMVFVCEHETQGLAYQEALSCGVPVVAWHSNAFWQPPAYYPDRVHFSPVTGVPYWDARCGVRFTEPDGFGGALDQLELDRAAGRLDPRGYVLDNLTLEKCAAAFVEHAAAAAA